MRGYNILVTGLPNNEAQPGQEDERAFPDALCEAMQMPRAAEYRGFNLKEDRLDSGELEKIR